MAIVRFETLVECPAPVGVGRSNGVGIARDGRVRGDNCSPEFQSANRITDCLYEANATTEFRFADRRSGKVAKPRLHEQSPRRFQIRLASSEIGGIPIAAAAIAIKTTATCRQRDRSSAATDRRASEQ